MKLGQHFKNVKGVWWQILYDDFFYRPSLRTMTDWFGLTKICAVVWASKCESGMKCTGTSLLWRPKFKNDTVFLRLDVFQ